MQIPTRVWFEERKSNVEETKANSECRNKCPVAEPKVNGLKW